MIYYLYILISVLMTAAVFCFGKMYQLKAGNARIASAFYSFATGLVSFAVFFSVNGFKVSFAPFSIIMALSGSLCATLYTFIGFRLMQYGKYAIYTTYLMVGGMTLPFIYGWMFLHESISLLRLAGLLMLIVVVILMNRKPEEKRNCSAVRYMLLCSAVFLLNGCVSIFSKMHQIETTRETLSTIPYAALSSLISCVSSGIWLFIEWQRARRNGDFTVKHDKKTWAAVIMVILGTSVLGAVSSFLQLYSAAHVDASVLYPMMTGGIIVLSAVAGRLIFGEKQSRREWLLIGLCFCATLLFLE